jgi:transcription antitermination factor NusG
VAPVFPSYVFIELDETTHWSPINSTYGCKQLLTYLDGPEYREPHRVPFVDELRRMQIRQPNDKDEDHGRIPIGTMVRIKRGKFVERIGLVEMATAARIRLLIECFGGREIAVTFDAKDIEVINRPLE